MVLAEATVPILGVSVLEFVTQFLPWLTYTIFIAGMLFRLAQWIVVPASLHADFRIDTRGISYASMVANFFFQTKYLEKKVASVGFWLMSYVMHFSLFGLLFFHTRPFGFWDWLRLPWLFPEETVTHTLPVLFAIVLTVTLTLLLVRRAISPGVRLISWLDDHVTVLLLFAIIFTGSLMVAHPHVAEPWSVTFLEGTPLALYFGMPTKPFLDWFVVHSVLVQLFIMYIPFSKLTHIFSTIIVLIVFGIKRLVSPPRA